MRSEFEIPEIMLPEIMFPDLMRIPHFDRVVGISWLKERNFSSKLFGSGYFLLFAGVLTK